MATWIKDITHALANLGGTAHYDELYAEVRRIRVTPLPDSWKKVIQRTVQDHAGESDGFKNERLFYSVNGKGSGVWGLVAPSHTATVSTDSGSDTLTGQLESGDDAPLRRNLAWSRDELILALDLYLRHRASPPGKESPEIKELSSFLNKMGSALGLTDTETFRNPNDVYMKLMNFRRFDPEYINGGKVELTRGNKDEEVVWAQFSGDSSRLQSVVAAIRSTVEESANGELGSEDDPIEEAQEGRVLTRLHRVRERSRALVEQCKKAALKKHGRLVCEACGFDFSVKYGDVGRGIIEVHHTKPVHTLTEGDKTKLEDLALLCANCHRVVHSSRGWLTVEQVKAAINELFPGGNRNV